MGEVVVGVRAGGPLVVKFGVGFGRTAFAAKGVREGEVPSVGRSGAGGFFVVEIFVFRERELPSLAVVFLDRMLFGVRLDERHRAIGA